MSELFDRKYECYTEKGSQLSTKFRDEFKDTIIEACKEYNTLDVEIILKDVISTIIMFERVKKTFKG